MTADEFVIGTMGSPKPEITPEMVRRGALALHFAHGTIDDLCEEANPKKNCPQMNVNAGTAILVLKAALHG